MSDADGRTTSVETLAEELDADRAVVEDHLDELAGCELATRPDDERVRVTITGKELLTLDVSGEVILDPQPCG